MPVAPMVAAAAISAAGSAIQGAQAGRAARRAQRAQAAAQAKAAAAAVEQRDYGKGMIEQWRSNYLPMLDDLKAMAYEKQTPDYAAITSDVGGAYDTAADIQRRNMERRGVNPADGAAADQETRYGLGRAGAIVDARNKARVAMKDATFNRLGQVFGASGTLATMGASTYNQGANNVINAYTGQASAAAQQQAQARSDAQSGWAGAGYGVGQIIQNWGNRGTGGSNTPSNPSDPYKGP